LSGGSGIGDWGSAEVYTSDGGGGGGGVALIRRLFAVRFMTRHAKRAKIYKNQTKKKKEEKEAET